MKEKGRLFPTIISVITLVLLGYVLFVSIYEQMISQNEGFFYVLVFGGILVLAFILLSLMTKLMAYSDEIKWNGLFVVFEVLIFIALSAFFVKSRLSYSTSLPADEALFYKAASTMLNGSISLNGMDLIPQLVVKPAQFVFAVFMSFIFRFTGAEPTYMAYVNIVLVLLILVCVYLSTRVLAGRISAILIVAFSIVMPCQTFSVYSYDAQLFFTFVFMLSFTFYTFNINSAKGGIAGKIVLNLFFGLFAGVVVVMEPATIIIFILLLLYDVIKLTRGWLDATIAIAALLLSFCICFFVNASLIDATASDMMSGYGRRFDVTENVDVGSEYSFSDIMDNFHELVSSQDKSITDNYYFLSNSEGQSYSSMQAAWFQLGNQLLYLFLIVLSSACAFYLIRLRYYSVMPCFLVFIGSFFVLFFEVGKERNTYFYVELLIMIGMVSLNYMYRNHHPELISNTVVDLEEIASDTKIEETEESEPVEESEEEKQLFMQRAYALVYIGFNEPLYKSIREEEKAILKSPRERLPLPSIAYNTSLDYDGKASPDKEFSVSASFGAPVNEVQKTFKTGIVLPSLSELTKATPVRRVLPIKQNPKSGPEVQAANAASAAPAASAPGAAPTQAAPATPSPAPVKLLDNPLPGPKPHVAKTLDYGKKTESSDDFDFDFDIDGNDDFDI